MNRTLERRLAQIEASRIVEAPSRILAGHPMTGEEAADALANWRTLVASGEASVMGGTLCILEPVLTEEEWAALHQTKH